MIITRRYFALAATSLVALLLGAEITLRVAFGLGMPIVYSRDRDAGYIAMPSQKVHRFGVDIHINAFGMRSDDISVHKPDGTYRLLILGDSVAYGTSRVDQADIFASVAQRELSKRLRRKVEMLNASAGGWAPGNELGYLRSRGTFKSDAVIMVINTLDLNQPFEEQAGDKMGSYTDMPNTPPPSALAELAFRYLVPRIRGVIETHDPGSIESPINPAVEVPPILETINQAREFAQASSATFSLLFLPQYYLASRADWALATQMLFDWAKARGVAVIDMSPDFLSAPASRYYLENIHPNSAGHALIAKRVVETWPAIASRN